MTVARVTAGTPAASNRTMLRNLAGRLLLAPFLLTGCAAPPAASEAPPAAPTLADVRYSCDGPPGFAPELLDQPANAELEDHPSSAALRAAIAEAGPDIDLLPESGYWLVSRENGVAQYLAREAPGGDIEFASATLEDQGGGWKLLGWGQCQPQIVLERLSLATWVLDPDLPAPDAETTSFTALVMERACASGQPMGARLQPPSITYGQESVVVVFAATPLGGDLQTCPSNPPMRAVVELREPLGDRELLDGAFFPPVEPIAPDF